LFALGEPSRSGAVLLSFGERAASLFCRPLPGFSVSMLFRRGYLIAIGFEPRHSRGKCRAQAFAARFEERIDGPTGAQEERLFLFVRRLGMFKPKLALGDKVRRGCGILIIWDWIGHLPAGELEMVKAFEKIGMSCRESRIEALDRVDRRLVVPDAGRRKGKRKLVHRGLFNKSGGRRVLSTGFGLPAYQD